MRSNFLKQINDSSVQSNSGLAYWIELNRGGHLYRTSNFADFHSGDQIRFHVLPNTDGFVYIVMHKGSSGSKSVLFPPDDPAINNFVKRGNECVVPKEGSLEFDQVPGTEQVGLLLSPTKIDPVAFITSRAVQPGQQSKALSKRAETTPSSNGGETSDLEKSFDAIFGATSSAISANTLGQKETEATVASGQIEEKAGGETLIESGNPGALEVLVIEGGAAAPEEPAKVLSSPSTALVVNENPNAVVMVDFGLKHD